jgi:predicted GH43/DUF377 family glycosyl hydrolase
MEFTMTRLGLRVDPEADNALEVEGVLNPAAVRDRDGNLYLFPRIVSKGNFSRIGILKVIFDAAGEPVGVERMGVALEPETPYELRGDGGGGCEDPRISYVEPLGIFVMTYTAFSPDGPRIALAYSEDLLRWTRLGLATFVPHEGLIFNGVDNKDAASFPVAIPSPLGALELGILHRPLFAGTAPEEVVEEDGDHDIDLHKESIWISYSSMGLVGNNPHQLNQFTSHHRLATPVAPWEILKIGTGTPPVLSRHGWLMVYHGVSESVAVDTVPATLTYCAGVVILDEHNPQHLLYRSIDPVLTPDPSVKNDFVKAVVFPTGIDRRDDIGQPDRYDVYYGVNDYSIGVARLDVPPTLPESNPKDLQP